MKKIGYILTFVSFLLLLGTVGNIEHALTPLKDGTILCTVYLALMVVGARIIKKYEENENE